jgi:hypothetical protein
MKLGPGLSYSWRRAIGLSGLRTSVARRTGIPTTRGGVERKVGRLLVRALQRLIR